MSRTLDFDYGNPADVKSAKRPGLGLEIKSLKWARPERKVNRVG